MSEQLHITDLDANQSPVEIQVTARHNAENDTLSPTEEDLLNMSDSSYNEYSDNQQVSPMTQADPELSASTERTLSERPKESIDRIAETERRNERMAAIALQVQQESTPEHWTSTAQR
jgi:hypothetical protein